MVTELGICESEANPLEVLIQEDLVRLKFGGSVSGIDVNTFTGVMLDYVAVAQAAVTEVAPGAFVDVNITAVEPGCLEAVLQYAPRVLEGGLDLIRSIGPILPDVIRAVTEFCGFKRAVAGGDGIENVEKDGQHISVKMRNGDNVSINQNTYNIYVGSSSALESVRETFENLERTHYSPS